MTKEKSEKSWLQALNLELLCLSQVLFLSIPALFVNDVYILKFWVAFLAIGAASISYIAVILIQYDDAKERGETTR
jgi:hypothetical protein